MADGPTTSTPDGKWCWVNSFDEDAVKAFYVKFSELEQDNTVGTIPVFIDSFGGPVLGYLAMRDMIKESSKSVATICISKAMSAGAMLLAAGSPGLRFVSKDAYIMIHEVGSVVFGKNADIKASQAFMDNLNRKVFNNLEEDTGKTRSFWEGEMKARLNADWFIDSKRAKKLGMVDHISLPKVTMKNPELMLVSLVHKKS